MTWEPADGKNNGKISGYVEVNHLSAANARGIPGPYIDEKLEDFKLFKDAGIVDPWKED